MINVGLGSIHGLGIVGGQRRRDAPGIVGLLGRVGGLGIVGKLGEVDGPEQVVGLGWYNNLELGGLGNTFCLKNLGYVIGSVFFV